LPCFAFSCLPKFLRRLANEVPQLGPLIDGQLLAETRGEEPADAPGGVADYAARLGPLYQRIAASRREHSVWDAPLIAEVERRRRAVLPADRLSERSAWRDRRLMALARHKREVRAGEVGHIDPEISG
jgi:hypothetical protein